MKELKSIIVLFVLIFGFFGCSDNDEEMEEVIPDLVIVSTEITETIKDGDAYLLKFKANINGEPNRVSARINGAGFTSTVNRINGFYTGSMSVNQNDYPNIKEFFIEILAERTINGNTEIIASETEKVTINWGTDLETISISSVEQVSLNGDTLILKTITKNNTLNQGMLTSKLFRNGNLLGTAENIFVGANSSVNTSYSHNSLAGDQTFQVLYENIDPNNPTYAFVNASGELIKDANGEPVSSIVLEFTSTAPSVVITTQGIDFSDISDTGFTSTLTLNSNTAGEKIFTRIYTSSDLSNIIKEYEHITTVGDQDIVNVFTDLSDNTAHTIRYYHGTSTSHFFTANQSTAVTTTGTLDVEIESLTAGVNNADTTVEFTNTTTADVMASIVFTGTHYMTGNQLVHTRQVTFTAHTTNTDIHENAAMFQQGSEVIVQVMIDGVEKARKSITTNIITQTSTNLSAVGAALTSGSTTNTVVATANTTSNGLGNFNSFRISLTASNNLDPNGYIDNLQIGSGNTLDVTWTETSTGSGVWYTELTQQELITVGQNSYTIGIKPETFTNATAGEPDIFEMSVSAVDDAGSTLSFGTIDISFKI